MYSYLHITLHSLHSCSWYVSTPSNVHILELNWLVERQHSGEKEKNIMLYTSFTRIHDLRSIYKHIQECLRHDLLKKNNNK